MKSIISPWSIFVLHGHDGLREILEKLPTSELKLALADLYDNEDEFLRLLNATTVDVQEPTLRRNLMAKILYVCGYQQDKIHQMLEGILNKEEEEGWPRL